VVKEGWAERRRAARKAGKAEKPGKR
jgi:hypothetical protein